LLLTTTPAWSYTCDPVANTCTPTITIGETSTYTSGAPITDLQDSLYTYTLNGVPATPLVIPALLTGGRLDVNATLKIPVPVCGKVTIVGSAVERTLASGVGPALSHPPLVLDRTKLPPTFTTPDPTCVTPSVPTSITVQ
jgi:hypothetical protein